jgi:hypothetical protein
MSGEPNYSINYSARRYGSISVTRGQLVVPAEDSTEYYVVATTANRNGRRSEAIALDTIGESQPGSIAIQQTGVISAELSGLSAGSASWVRCSADGEIERCSPVEGDDIVGYADADGRVHLMFGILTAAIVGVAPSGAVTPEMYGAAGDGVTDDTAELQAALDAINTAGGGCLALRADRTYLITANLTAYANTRITGQGLSSVISSVTNDDFIVVAGNNVTVDNLLLSGTWGAGSSQHGISVGAYLGFLAINVHTYGLGGRSFNVTASAGNFQGQAFIGCTARLNLNPGGTGFYVSGQYAKLIGCETYGCAVGLVMNAGNIVAVGCNVNASNTTGVHVTSNASGASNDAHCVLDGCNINHTDTNNDALYVEDITNGLVVTGCHIYYGDIYLESSDGVRFVGCTIDVDNIYFDGSQGTAFNTNTWPKENANTRHPNHNGNTSTEYFAPDNYDLTGAVYPTATVTTTDATVTTLDTVNLTLSTGTYAIEWIVTATTSDGTQGAVYKVFAGYRVATGTPAQIGSASVTAIEDDAAWNCTADRSGSTARLRVTGVPIATIKWSAIRTQLTVIP